MPANLTPDYLAAEQDYKRAQTHLEKIQALEQMMATLPRHKGTEKLQADIRRRLSQERKEAQQKSHGLHAPPFYLVKKEGAGQVALVGPPNAGKSQLVCALTHARPEVAEFPFTTRTPAPGMMLHEDVSIQLLDLPPVSPDFMEPWMPQAVRAATLTVLVVDPSDAGVLDEIEFALRTLDQWRVPPPALLVANKLDLPGAPANFEALRELYGARLPCLGLSALASTGLGAFARAVFEALNVVRFYSKPPGKPPDLTIPYILHRGETVQAAAARVHRDLAEHLRYARLFHKNGGHDGLMVERSHVVEDGDILEFHEA